MARAIVTLCVLMTLGMQVGCRCQEPAGLADSVRALQAANASSPRSDLPRPASTGPAATGPAVPSTGSATSTSDAVEREGEYLLSIAEPAGSRLQPAGVDWHAIRFAPATTNPATDRAESGDSADRDEPYEHWSTRVGPAYPGDPWHSLGRDVKELPLTMWDDTKATFTNPVSLTLLASAAVSGALLISEEPDEQIARHYIREVGGNPGTHFAIAGAMYAYGLWQRDDHTYEVAKSMINALSINGLITMATKVALRTEVPNGNEFGWASGHTSSSFAFATVLYHHYGPWVGVPMMAFASFVGYERIDSKRHDFSDVVAGALIGLAVGHAVAGNHQPKIMGMDVTPILGADGTVGVLLHRRF